MLSFAFFIGVNGTCPHAPCSTDLEFNSVVDNISGSFPDFSAQITLSSIDLICLHALSVAIMPSQGLVFSWNTPLLTVCTISYCLYSDSNAAMIAT